MKDLNLAGIGGGNGGGNSGSGFGFTYDQQAVPSSPTAGQTWLERNGSGLIINTWERIGSNWIGLDLKSVEQSEFPSGYASYNGSQSKDIYFAPLPRDPFFLVRLIWQCRCNTATDEDNYGYAQWLRWASDLDVIDGLALNSLNNANALTDEKITRILTVNQIVSPPSSPAHYAWILRFRRFNDESTPDLFWEWHTLKAEYRVVRT